MARATDRPRLAAESLLHDGSEAYTGDMISPIKHHPKMAWFRSLEERVDQAIRERFGIRPVMSKACHRLDQRMLRAEIEQLLPPGRYEFAPRVKPLDVTIECWSESRARREFLRTARELGLS